MVSKYRDILEPPLEQHIPDQVIEKYDDNEKGLIFTRRKGQINIINIFL